MRYLGLKWVVRVVVLAGISGLAQAAAVVPVAASGPVQTIQTTNTYDANGNMVQVVMSTTSNTLSGTPTYTKTTLNTYGNVDTAAADPWQLGWLTCSMSVTQMPVDPLLTSQDLISVKSSTYTYDITAPTLANYIHIETSGVVNTSAAPTACTAPDAANSVTSTYTYDSFGNHSGTTLSGPNITTRTASTQYDTNGIFPTVSYNALNQAVSRTFDPVTGQVLSLKDPNAQTTVWTYDDLGRQLTELHSDGTKSTTSYALCDGSCNTTTYESNEAYMVVSSDFDRNGVLLAPPATTYFDVLGRSLRKVSTGFGGNPLTSLRIFNAQGQLTTEVQPYFTPLQAGEQINQVSYAYDGLGNLKTTTEPGNRVSQVQHVSTFETHYINPLQQTRIEKRNGLALVVETDDNSGQAIKYTYNVNGSLRKTTDPLGNVIEVQYDALGHKNKVIDPDLGTWSYTYDNMGNLLTQTNGNGQVTTNTYDLLGRLTNRVEADLASAWIYDSAVNGVGKLAKETANNGYERDFLYDVYGRLSTDATKKAIDPNAQSSDPDFIYTTSYDAAGRVSTLTYPTGLSYQNIYDANGYLQKVVNTGSQAAYWTANNRDAWGHVTQETLGNGLVTARSYQTNTGLVQGITTGSTSAPSSIQSDSYTFDSLGNLWSRSQGFGGNSLTETYGYDNLNRLTNTYTYNNTVLTNSASAVYDALGNIQSRSDVGVYSYGAAIMASGASGSAFINTWVPIDLGSGVPNFFSAPVPANTEATSPAGACGGVHRLCAIGNGMVNTSFTYDANGNMLTGNGRGYTWTSFNMPASISQGATTDSFLYTADHERVRQVSVANGQTSTTVYINPRIDTGGTFEKDYLASGVVQYVNHLYAGGHVIGSVVMTVGTSSPQLRYFHTDHLGSIEATTDASGNIVERFSYDAWGMRRNTDGTPALNGAIAALPTDTDHGFTGHEMLDSVGLINMNGRVYDPQVGRFISADPNIDGADDTQGYNRYSYVYNNPLSFTDPSGFWGLGNFIHDVEQVGHSLGDITIAFGDLMVGNLSGATQQGFDALQSMPGMNKVDNEILRHKYGVTILQTVAAIGCGAVSGGVGSASCSAGVSAYFVGVEGGNGEAMLRVGGRQFAVSLASEQLNLGIGHTFPVSASSSYLAISENVAAHALLGGAESVVQGGSFRSGAMAGAFGAINDNLVPDIEGPIQAAFMGALGAKLTGGDPAIGALTGAYSYMYNHCEGRASCFFEAIKEDIRFSRNVWHDLFGGEIKYESPSLSEIWKSTDEGYKEDKGSGVFHSLTHAGVSTSFDAKTGDSALSVGTPITGSISAEVNMPNVAVRGVSNNSGMAGNAARALDDRRVTDALDAAYR